LAVFAIGVVNGAFGTTEGIGVIELDEADVGANEVHELTGQLIAAEDAAMAAQDAAMAAQGVVSNISQKLAKAVDHDYAVQASNTKARKAGPEKHASQAFDALENFDEIIVAKEDTLDPALHKNEVVGDKKATTANGTKVANIRSHSDDEHILLGGTPLWSDGQAERSCAALDFEHLNGSRARLRDRPSDLPATATGGARRRAALCIAGRAGGLSASYAQWESSTGILPALRRSNYQIDFFVVAPADAAYTFSRSCIKSLHPKAEVIIRIPMIDGGTGNWSFTDHPGPQTTEGDPTFMLISMCMTCTKPKLDTASRPTSSRCTR
jgi:hypothetical protein